MRIRSVSHNNRKKVFEVKCGTRVLPFPYGKAEPQPRPDDPVRQTAVDKELGNEGFIYSLQSGKTGTIHLDQVLEYNQDPSYMRDALLYKLTLVAQERLEKITVSKREIIRRLGTSATQFYRLLDQTNYQKSVDQLLSLLHILDCDVELVVRARKPSRHHAA